MPDEKYANKIVTVPNLLSLFRILLIPVIVWLYCVKHAYPATVAVLCLSGLTDLVDGFVARRFNMVSNLGKALDPIADKLTQGVMLLCLITNFPIMLIPFILLALKEIIMGVSGLIVIRRTGAVHGADWHGKVTTCLIYVTMILHAVWYNIPRPLSVGLVVCCVAMMLLSLILYTMRNFKLLRAGPDNQRGEKNV